MWRSLLQLPHSPFLSGHWGCCSFFLGSPLWELLASVTPGDLTPLRVVFLFTDLFFSPLSQTSVQLSASVWVPIAEAIIVHLALFSFPQAHGVWGLRRVVDKCIQLTALETAGVAHQDLLPAPFLPTIHALILSTAPSARFLTFSSWPFALRNFFVPSWIVSLVRG